MKLAVIAVLAAASLAGSVDPAPAAPRQEVRPGAILKTAYYNRHRPPHHRHRVCVIRHHRRICYFR